MTAPHVTSTNVTTRKPPLARGALEKPTNHMDTIEMTFQGLATGEDFRTLVAGKDLTRRGFGWNLIVPFDDETMKHYKIN